MTLPFLFFGTPEFAVLVLSKLKEANQLPAAVVCQPDRPKGRGLKPDSPPVKQWAQKIGVPILQPEQLTEPSFVEQFASFCPSLALVAAFGKIIPGSLLQVPPLGFVNVHPSLLPKYRGAAPMQWALLNGDETTGVTLLRVTPRLDDGDILLQKSVPLGPNDAASELHDRLGILGGVLSVSVLELMESGPVSSIPQDETQVVWARALEKDDGHIDWSLSARSIHNRIRGLQPWPGAFSFTRDKRLKLHRASVEPAPEAGHPPGRIVKAQGGDLLVASGDGWVRLLEVQWEGKKRLDIQSFLLGRSLHVGDTLA
jgi:methionyl-tRNA formyltransferase